MNAKKFALPLVILLFFSMACSILGAGQPDATPTPAETATATIDSAATQSAQATSDAQATAEAKASQEAQATSDAQATADAITQATAAVKTRTALDKSVTATAVQGVKVTATAAVKATAEAQEAAFKSVVQKLADEGKVGSTEGEYYRVEDFDRAEAKMNYFFPYTLGYDAENFVMSMDMKWASASMNANWFSSGCGILYGIQGEGEKAILTFLGLDGYAHTLMGYKGGWPQVAFKKWGKPELPQGEATLMLVLWDKQATVYVNGELTSEYRATLYQPGDLGLTVLSGSNKDFGTRCQLTNIDLFLFK